MYILNNMGCVVEIIQYKRFDWKAQTLSFNPFQNDQFLTLSNWKSLQTPISNRMKMPEGSPNE